MVADRSRIRGMVLCGRFEESISYGRGCRSRAGQSRRGARLVAAAAGLVCRTVRGGWSWQSEMAVGKGVEFGGHCGGLGRANLLEDLECLTQFGLRGSRAANCQSAAAQLGQRPGFIRRAADIAGQPQRPPVALAARVRSPRTRSNVPASLSTSDSPCRSPRSR